MIESLAALLVPGVVGILAGGFYLLRRWSRDKLEIAKDRAEADVMAHLIRQRDEAEKKVENLRLELEQVADANEEAVEKIRQLTTLNEQMKSQLGMLNLLVKRLAAMNNLPTTNIPNFEAPALIPTTTENLTKSLSPSP